MSLSYSISLSTVPYRSGAMMRHRIDCVRPMNYGINKKLNRSFSDKKVYLHRENCDVDQVSMGNLYRAQKAIGGDPSMNNDSRRNSRNFLRHHQMNFSSATIIKKDNQKHDHGIEDCKIGNTDEHHGNESEKTQIDSQKVSSLSEISPSDLKLALESAQEDRETNAAQTETETSSASLNLNDVPGTSTGGGNRQLAIIYTCNVCNTRSAKKFTERAYNHGVVLVRCPNCESLHLIADRLGYFTDDGELDGDHEVDDNGSGESRSKRSKGWDIEKFMKKVGKEDNIKVVTNGDNGDVLEVMIDDIVGKENMPR